MYKILLNLVICSLISHTIWGQDTIGKVDSILSTMTLDQKIGQLFMIAAYSNKDADYEKELEETITRYHVGGIIFFQGSPVRQALMTNHLQQLSPIPLLIGMDAESGLGWRIKQAMEFPNQTLLGAIRDNDLIYRIGQSIGEDCRLLGVHVNFAPVVDINTNPKNPIIGIRSFGEKKKNVSQKSIAYMQGLNSQNVMAVAKHFPGHGDTDVDSHLALPLIKFPATRLDSVELYPFKELIEAGVPGVMVSHLNVPAYDTANLPASLSPRIATELLRNQLRFEGLCFTDAMNMKGVTLGRAKGKADLLALMAGNNVLLFPENIAASIKKIKEAIKNGKVSEELIHERCRQLLLAKEKYVMPSYYPIDTNRLIQRLNTPQDSGILQTAYAKAITLIKNNDLLLPFTKLDTLRMASLNFGDRKATAFENMLSNYAPCDHFSISNEASPEKIQQLLKKLASYNCIIIYNSAARNSMARQFGASLQLSNIIKKLKGKRLVLCHPATPYGVDLYSYLPVDAILISYSHDLPAQEFSAQALFGGIRVEGKLPVSINLSYPAGTGLTTPKIRLGYHLPVLSGMDSFVLQRIDSICQAAIQAEATPGCEVLVAKDGYIVYNKAFGYHTYQKKKPNRTNDIYDIASVTKIAATLPTAMMLYDEKKIALDSPISRYYPPIIQTNKANITIREILLHMAALKPAVSFFYHAIDKGKLSGRLFSPRRTKENCQKLRERLYLNPHFSYRDSTFCHEPREDYTLISPHFYIHKQFRDSIHEILLNSELLPQKKYTYSDIGFVLLKDISESQTSTSFDRFCKEQLFKRIGANNTAFQAYRTLNPERIVPSAEDLVFRKSLLKGYVHDPIAALLNGISGNAGLFTNTGDLAKIMAMYLNHGEYGGERFIDSATVALFTSTQLPAKLNRRGLGFDKPEQDASKTSPACAAAPLSSYGHSGFTGTIAWNDPDNKMIYIFLSNRTFPNEYNDKLIQENIRTKIQEVLYKALSTPTQAPLYTP
ncbi:glycoside hydrolase family 3 N-terminal domain-containing protein [Sanguibacteroides justesenii]|uniref:glycoside hydrolase family 3 N-terminal domain-containing protein n=1 Tax=Sanguibacteroides justesenii TaxID=1547597 RepID=UPI000696F4C4|nr:glycoside hydrolase family 3 N-terminal domain-containing protein [Sanguibacteroides justesenii]